MIFGHNNDIVNTGSKVETECRCKSIPGAFMNKTQDYYYKRNIITITIRICITQDAASQDSQEAPASKKPKLEVQPTSEVEAPAAIMKTTAAIPFDFTPAFLLLSESWSTLTEHANKGGPKEFQLDNFAFDKKQTLAFKVSHDSFFICIAFNTYLLIIIICLDIYNTHYVQLTVPANSPRWSVNIGFPSDLGWQNILLHFNPRKEKKKRRYQLLHNDRTANHWGLIESMLIDEDLLFGRTFELVLQVSDGVYCSLRYRYSYYTLYNGRFSRTVSSSLWMGRFALSSRIDLICTINRKLQFIYSSKRIILY